MKNRVQDFHRRIRMEYISGDTNFKFHNTAVTLGKFDGIHLGHQYLMKQVADYKKLGYKTIMFSFLFHPCNLFSDREIELIYTEEEKRYKLEKSDLDVLISYPFTQETRSMKPEAFIKDILVDQLDAKVIVVGSDFHFGYKKRGNIQLLQELQVQYGYKVVVCDKMKLDDTVISSSTIRSELQKGNLELVNAMLGQPYTIIGEVQHGRKIGRTIGIPTTNLIPATNKLLPPCGVYASKTYVDGTYYDGVTNIGFKPTVGAEKRKGVETYLFDYDNDLYGKLIEVELFTYERPEMKFNSLEELKYRMQLDITFTQKYFKEHNN